MIDKKSKIILGVFIFIVIVATIATYYRYVILGDFEIFTDEEAFNEALLEE